MTNADLASQLAETLWKRSLIFSEDEKDVAVAIRTALDMHRPQADEPPEWVLITEATDG